MLSRKVAHPEGKSRAGQGWAGQATGWVGGRRAVVTGQSGVTCWESPGWPAVSSLGVGASSGCGASSPAPPLPAPGVLFRVAAF